MDRRSPASPATEIGREPLRPPPPRSDVAGQLVLTEAAVAMLGEGVEAVHIGYNAKSRVVGLRPAADGVRGALKLRAQPSAAGRGWWMPNGSSPTGASPSTRRGVRRRNRGVPAAGGGGASGRGAGQDGKGWRTTALSRRLDGFLQAVPPGRLGYGPPFLRGAYYDLPTNHGVSIRPTTRSVPTTVSCGQRHRGAQPVLWFRHVTDRSFGFFRECLLLCGAGSRTG